MPITFECSSCGARIRTSRKYAGQRGRCPGCKIAIRIPGLDGNLVAESDQQQIPSTAAQTAFRFVVVEGPAPGHVFELPQGFVEVGRSPECTVAIAGDLSVSPKHCQLAVLVSRCFVRDLGSEFGTFVNDQKLEKDHELKDGDQVRVGSGTVLRLEATVEGGIEDASLEF
jgi:pSer/pThr/pTyr-binding forkhead associated (FHA) protein